MKELTRLLHFQPFKEKIVILVIKTEVIYQWKNNLHHFFWNILFKINSLFPLKLPLLYLYNYIQKERGGSVG